MKQSDLPVQSIDAETAKASIAAFAKESTAMLYFPLGVDPNPAQNADRSAFALNKIVGQNLFLPSITIEEINRRIPWSPAPPEQQKPRTADSARGSSDFVSVLACKIASEAERNAQRTDTVGWCYRGVANTLGRFGIRLYGKSAYMAAPQLARHDRFQEVSAHGELPKGTVLVFGPTQKHPHGHITVYLGNGKEASDHVQNLVSYKKYSGVRAFVPV